MKKYDIIHVMKHLCAMVLFTVFLLSPAWAQEPITVTAVGDIMMGTDWPEDMLPPHGGRGIFRHIEKYLEGDIVMGNLEGPITTSGTSAKCKKPSRKCYEFRTPPSMTARLDEAGFNTLSIANNHSYDFGPQGVTDTIANLNKHGIQPIGGKAVATFDIRGTSIAIAGFSFIHSKYSYPVTDIPRAAGTVSRLKKKHDIVIVTFHGGAEGRKATHLVPEDEIFLRENRGNLIAFSHAMVDAGADLVIGHGPHVLRGMELYDGRLIAYSMGNFLTYERFNISGANGISAVLSIKLDPSTGRLMSGLIHSVKLKGAGIPYPDTRRIAVHQIKRLTDGDLPQQPLVITESGELSIFAPDVVLSDAPSAQTDTSANVPVE
jgi:hypothetical protein